MATVDTTGWKTTPIFGVLYSERIKGYREHRELLNDSAKRIFHTKWADRANFILEHIGGSVKTGETQITYPSVQHPEFTDMVAISGDVEGLANPTDGGENEQISFDIARINITYGVTEFSILDPDKEPIDEVLVTERVTLSGEFITIEGEVYSYQTAPSDARVDHNVGKFIGGLEFQITEHKVRTVSISQMQGLVSKVNASSWRGFDAETVLYMGSEVTNTIGTSSNPLEVTHVFKVRPTLPTWNQTYRAENGNWSLAQFPDRYPWDGTSPLIYETANLQGVFQG